MKLIYLAHPFGGSEGDTGSLFCACDEMLLNFQQYVELHPAADVSEVVHGEWGTDRDTIRCSVCGFGYFPHGYFFKDGQCIGDLIFDRCPNCGAHMERSGSGE